jgi:hypothetical protein
VIPEDTATPALPICYPPSGYKISCDQPFKTFGLALNGAVADTATITTSDGTTTVSGTKAAASKPFDWEFDFSMALTPNDWLTLEVTDTTGTVIHDSIFLCKG